MPLMLKNWTNITVAAAVFSGALIIAPEAAARGACEDLFAAADTNGSGSLSRDEYSAAFDGTPIGGLFDLFDTNGDDEISLAEWLARCSD
ncbi:MAG: hypothetical protein AAFX09_09985 [Pseudomonadota bacterium]